MPPLLFLQVVALGFCFGKQSYLQSSWNILDGVLVFVSLVDILVSLAYTSGNRILGILRVLRLLRTLRPLRFVLCLVTEFCISLLLLTFTDYVFRVISRAPGLKLVVETLITSLRPIGNIVLICCAFFIVFGILGVQVITVSQHSHVGTSCTDYAGWCCFPELFYPLLLKCQQC